MIWAVLTVALAANQLDAGRAALVEFQYEEAVVRLEQALEGGPYSWNDHVSLYESLGVAYASLGRTDEARSAFVMVLALDPGHAIPYTLAPKITFIFETARREIAEKASTELDVNWPQDLRVEDAVPVSVAVVADPATLLQSAILFTRRKGETDFREHKIVLLPPGQFQTLEVPAPEPPPTGASALELYVVGHDKKGNEVLELAGPTAPRTIGLGYEKAVPWYGRWWVWAAVAGVVAAGVSVGVYVAVQPPPDTVPANVVKNWP